MASLFKRQRTSGQSLVEFALIVPFVTIFAFSCIQFAIIFWAYISMMNVTRDAARWLAVHPNTTDAAFEAEVVSRLPSNLDAASLTLTYSPECPSLSNGKCSSRPMGVQQRVTTAYDVSSVLFLPTTFGWGSWSISIPTTLSPYSVFMQVEPS